MFKELDYIKSDLNYKTELLMNLEAEFFTYINNVLNNNPNLKSMYEKQFEKKYKDIDKTEDVFNNPIDIDVDKELDTELDTDEDVKDINIDKNIKSDKLKKLYRKIVKLTHPDIVQNINMNNIYIDATTAYDNDDIYIIYSLCSRLNIDYDVELEDIDHITNNINMINNQIRMIESSYPWQWSNGESITKIELALSYIRDRII